MFRLLRLIILLIIIIVIVAGVYLWMARVPTLERFFSKQLNSKVTIEEVQIGWAKLKIEGLRIENPSQSTLPYAFQGGMITLEMSPFELWQKRVNIDRIKFQNPTIGVQLYNNSGSDNNWAHLLNSFPSGGKRKFVIKKLTILNLQFEVVRSNGKTLSIPSIPYSEFENLGEKGALTLSQVGRVIFQTMLYTLTSKPHLGVILDTVTALP